VEAAEICDDILRNFLARNSDILRAMVITAKGVETQLTNPKVPLTLDSELKSDSVITLLSSLLIIASQRIVLSETRGNLL